MHVPCPHTRKEEANYEALQLPLRSSERSSLTFAHTVAICAASILLIRQTGGLFGERELELKGP